MLWQCHGIKKQCSGTSAKGTNSICTPGKGVTVRYAPAGLLRRNATPGIPGIRQVAGHGVLKRHPTGKGAKIVRTPTKVL